MTPDWFRQAVIYHILIDRFAGFPPESPSYREPVFCGGNLKGIIKKLGYVKDLGAAAIWLSPFNKTTDYHGYHVTDFFFIEPRFGTLEDFKELIDRAYLIEAALYWTSL